MHAHTLRLSRRFALAAGISELGIWPAHHTLLDSLAQRAREPYKPYRAHRATTRFFGNAAFTGHYGRNKITQKCAFDVQAARKVRELKRARRERIMPTSSSGVREDSPVCQQQSPSRVLN